MKNRVSGAKTVPRNKYSYNDIDIYMWNNKIHKFVAFEKYKHKMKKKSRLFL